MATRGLGKNVIQRLLILAQLLALVALLMGLLFFLNTTGGTLFLFSAVAPGLIAAAVLMVGVVAYYYFRQQHRLFDIVQFAPGEIIVHQGDPGDCVYFVREGEVEVQRDGAVVAVLTAGSYFGETALLTSEPRNATIRSVGATQLASLGKANFLTMLRLLPSTKENILATIQERAMERN